jgi:ABC superfamily ATP binding cassette transporter, permease
MYTLLEEIWSTTRRNKLRTALTGFAVAWGIFMLIFLLGAGNGLINAGTINMSRFLANSIAVAGGYTSKEYNGLPKDRAIELNDKDFNVTRDQFGENVETVGAEIDMGNHTMVLGDSHETASLMGVYPNEIDINKRELLSGRFINQTDIEEQRRVLVVSKSRAEGLVGKNWKNIVGEHVTINGLAFLVVGVYSDDESMFRNNSFAPFTTLRTIYNKGDKADQIVFSFKGLETEAQNEAFENVYRHKINALHDAAPDDEESVWIWNRFTQSMKMNMGMGFIRTALWIVGIFILLSGIVGVSNIMLITVKERTREFGIRKAIGATPWSILKLIITESVIITLIFGYIGMMLGIGANLYMDATLGNTTMDAGAFQQKMFVDPTVGFGVCIQATLLIVIAGTIAGVIPARKAAKIRPIEALNAME